MMAGKQVLKNNNVIMKKSDIKIVPEYYLTYINKANEEPLMNQLEEGGIAAFLEHQEKLEAIGNQTYAKGKWTVKEIIEHLIDTERIFQTRALRFVRQDKTPLPGYDENMYAAVSQANDRSIEELLEEYQIVRMSSYILFKNLDKNQLQFTGIANGHEISVLAIGFILIGHAEHHFGVIRDRYFPLLEG